MKLTKELADRISEHLGERRADTDNLDNRDGINEVDDAIKILEENIGKELGSIDHALVSRLMDDDELQEEFRKCESEESDANIFDSLGSKEKKQLKKMREGLNWTSNGAGKIKWKKED